MMIKQTILVSLSALTMMTASYAAENNFACPQPAEIQSTDFTAPSVWVAPPVARSVPDVVGVGLGGKEVKEFIAAEPAVVNHRKGWVCVYKTEGFSIREYQSKILNVLASNKLLRKYYSKVNQEFENAEPYLKNYPKDMPIGFVGYQRK